MPTAAPVVPTSLPVAQASHLPEDFGARLQEIYEKEKAIALNPLSTPIEAARASAAANAAASAAHPVGGGQKRSTDAVRNARSVLAAFLKHQDHANPTRNFAELYGQKAHYLPGRLDLDTVATETFWKDVILYLMVVYKSPTTRSFLQAETIRTHVRVLLYAFELLDVRKEHASFYAVLSALGDTWLKKSLAAVDAACYHRNHKNNVSNVKSAESLFPSHTTSIGRALFRAASDPAVGSISLPRHACREVPSRSASPLASILFELTASLPICSSQASAC